MKMRYYVVAASHSDFIDFCKDAMSWEPAVDAHSAGLPAPSGLGQCFLLVTAADMAGVEFSNPAVELVFVAGWSEGGDAAWAEEVAALQLRYCRDKRRDAVLVWWPLAQKISVEKTK